MTSELRDWLPGDGLTCTYSKRAPEPCGRPIKTAVSTQSGGPGRPDRIVKRPLCEHHAVGRTTGWAPGKVRAEADRRAHQRLVHEHWAEFQRYVSEATAEIRSLVERGDAP